MSLPRLVVGRQSAGFLRRGHPWVRLDRFTRGLEALRAGQAVTLVDERETPLGSALADPEAQVCARVYHRKPDATFDPSAAIARAWGRRADLHHDPDTDCYRLVHGEGDFLPGLIVDRLAEVLVVTVRTRAIEPHLDACCRALVERLPGVRIVIRRHLDDIRRHEPELRAWRSELPPASTEIVGRELGVELPLTPFAGLATGIYIDQRATRTWLRERCAGARIANCFAYTGLFSLSLLAGGAASALDLDLAAGPLAVAERAAQRNGLSVRHRIRRGDCRALLEANDERFDIVICDPPTAAQGGTGAWIARRDYPRLLATIRSRLTPGGLLLATSNTLGRRFALDAAVRLAGFDVIDGPPLGADLPQLAGFPEGRPFTAVAARARP